MEKRLSLIDEAAWSEVKKLYKIYNEGWSKLSGTVRGKTILTTLSEKEREVAKLAAFGMSNQEIEEAAEVFKLPDGRYLVVDA